jgi:peptidoglycan/xylan/chitin deacetylase (PgdA/CDA1 family)
MANRFQCHQNDQGKLAFPFVRKRRSGSIQILVYHRVNDENDPFFSGIPIHIFNRQMEYVASNFNVIPLEEAVERLTKRDIPDNALVVTFDDGYRDNYVNAFPILRDLSIPATIFLATDSIDSQKMLWHDRVFAAFRSTRVSLLEGFGPNAQTYRLSTIEEKLIAQDEVLKFIRSQNERERLILIDRLIRALKVVDLKEMSGLMLSWDEVRTMRTSGICFGSHTLTHPILSKLPLEKARDEIQKSREIIEEILGIPVRTFAYPNGTDNDFNETTKLLLRESGYICALTTKFGANDYDQDLFELRRATPWDQYVSAFGLRLNYYKFCS